MRIRTITSIIPILITTAYLYGCTFNGLRNDSTQDLNSQTTTSTYAPEQQDAIWQETEELLDELTADEGPEEIEDLAEDIPEEGTESKTSHETAAETGTGVLQNTNILSATKKLLHIQDKDLWHRLRAGLKLEIPDNQRTTQHITWLKKHKAYLRKLQERSKPYIYFILTEAEKRNLPTELALLPAVESSYRPFAYSHGSAAGLWQFVPSTGRHFKLKQNWWYDGRRDVVASTHAAFDYLESLARRYDGNWELALAAYNCGSGNVNKAIRENRRQGKPTDFWSLNLPKETRSYVPRLLALSSIIKDPAVSGVELISIPYKPYFESVDIGSQLDLAMAASMAEITTDEIYLLNPGLNRWATAPNGPHRLNLPVDKVEGFKQRLAELTPNQRIHWERYQIQSGDTVSTIAKKYGTTSELIKQANDLNNNSIRAGKYLVIPTATKSLEHYTLTADKRKQRIQNRTHEGNKIIHVVQEGDNFWDLSRTYHVSYRSLAKWNGMAPKDTLKQGQKLVVWVDNKTFKETKQLPNIMDVRPPSTSTRNSVYYKVRTGDSLSTIAHRFKVKVADLKKWNDLSGKYLKPGQNLKLYVDVTSQAL